MKKAPDTAKAASSAPDTAKFTVPGNLPQRKNTVTAEVLTRLLNHERLTSLDGVYEASTTRLSAVAFHLAERWSWAIQTTDKATGCVDGRVAWIVEYHLHPEAIAQVMQDGAEAWCAEVRKARLERRKKAVQAMRAAAAANAARCPGQRHIGQSSLFEGYAA